MITQTTNVSQFGVISSATPIDKAIWSAIRNREPSSLRADRTHCNDASRDAVYPTQDDTENFVYFIRLAFNCSHYTAYRQMIWRIGNELKQ